MDPALAAQPFAARLLQLHDSDGDGVLTQVPPCVLPPPTLRTAQSVSIVLITFQHCTPFRSCLQPRALSESSWMH